MRCSVCGAGRRSITSLTLPPAIPPFLTHPHINTNPHDAQAAAWFYQDKDGGQAGPVDVQRMAGLFQSGEVDGLTMVWHAELPGGWKQLAEVGRWLLGGGGAGCGLCVTD